MKKPIAYILSLFILLSAIPTQAFAAENNVSKHDALVDLACEVFPEYTSIIRAEPNAASAIPFSDDTNSVVFSETRNISDTESLSISQLSSGTVVILKNNSSIFKIYDSNVSTSDISTVGVSGTASFEVTCNYDGCGTFELSNVQFVIYYTGSDYFSNYGTPDPGYGISIGTKSISSTYINYPLTFSFSANQFVNFELYFSNDQLVAKIS